ncbi:MAG: hypothetical protein ABEI96_01265 [Haloarculaceae archaeon]
MPTTGSNDGFDSAEDAAETVESRTVESRTVESRTVVVPNRIYKAVTVFSTLFAVVTVVGGFVVLDTATNRATAPLSQVDPILALAGLFLVALGAVTYAFSTRFKADGMENAKDAADERSNNG